MNKAELIDTVAQELKTSKADAQRAVDAVLDSLVAGIGKDEKVQLAGFGTFQKKTRAARTGVNPRTREPMQIAESTTCSFKPATALRQAI